MNRLVIKVLFYSTCLIIFGCTKDYEETFVDLSSYQIEDGFKVEAIAAEPLIEAPVDLRFDDQGRLWVVEMPGYMRSTEGLSEDAPIGRISILDDRDNDGKMDHVIPFLDSLSLVRAIAHVYGGLLYAEPPNLFFIEIEDGVRPGKRTLVDAEYAVGGNVEHQPNGLMMNIDNWIYSAKGSKRYRRKNGVWEISETSFRGQWGLTSDFSGRLIYNDNSTQARIDWTYPNMLNTNKWFTPRNAIGSVLIPDQNVYPIQATAVNRGYIDGVLHDDGKLARFTSACGPLYFEGVGLSDEYQYNVFVCGPEANLIKRNILDKPTLRQSGNQAWAGKEFLISSDETFRPVNLQNGPDGAMYVSDMHRGIIQHKTYMTSYLRKIYLEKGLDGVVGMGRILRISKEENGEYATVDITTSSNSSLVDSLYSRNRWIRDKAQHLLIHNDANKEQSSLEKALTSAKMESTRIHALYTLEGLGLLSEMHLDYAAATEFPFLLTHFIKLANEIKFNISPDHYNDLISLNNEMVDFHLANYLSSNLEMGNQEYLTTLIDRYGESGWFEEAVMTGLADTKDIFRTIYTERTDYLEQIENRIAEYEARKLRQPSLGRGLTSGLVLYQTHCATCHGPDGVGIESIAPPLLESEYISGPEARLVAVLLRGISGPITVNGKNYEFAAPMPGIGSNTEITDIDIRSIANFVRNAFTTSPSSVRLDVVDSLRNINRPIDKMYTEKEINEIF